MSTVNLYKKVPDNKGRKTILLNQLNIDVNLIDWEKTKQEIEKNEKGKVSHLDELVYGEGDTRHLVYYL